MENRNLEVKKKKKTSLVERIPRQDLPGSCCMKPEVYYTIIIYMIGFLAYFAKKNLQHISFTAKN